MPRTDGFLLGALAGALLACSSEETPTHPPDYCAEAEQHLTACSVIPPVLSFACDADEIQDQCRAGCTIAADCGALLEPSRDYAACDATCRQRWLCVSGQEIYAAQICDGRADCSDASDEADCDPQSPTFDCADGSDTIPLQWRCDGTPDCGDASDEAGC